MDWGQILSWVVVVVGLVGFRLVGKKVWWAWFVNLGCQILWYAYAVVTNQPAFLLSASAYTVAFAINAFEWTKEHRVKQRILKEMRDNKNGTIILPNGVTAAYSMLDAAYTKFDLDLIARVCHESNRILQLTHDDENPSYPWHLASDAQKKSAIEGVKKALDGATAVELHEAWCRQKIADGWVYGETKDEGIKTHPCLVPYSKLPEEQRIKDHMFRAIVKSFMVDAQEKDSKYANVSQ